MGDKEITFLLHPSATGLPRRWETMAGQIDFTSHIEIDVRIIHQLKPSDLDNLYQKVRDQGAQAIVNDVMEWLKESFPHELESYIDMMVHDLIRSQGFISHL